MKSNLFFGCVSADQVQLRYDELTKIFSDQEEMLQSLKTEYSTLMSVLTESKPVEEVKEETFTVADIIKLVQERFNPEGLKLELSGTWIWLSGAGTFAIKEGLKQLGFRYSVNKKSFYWRSDEDRSANSKPVPIELIRKKYGSNEVALR
jgi:hypothetical protein